MATPILYVKTGCPWCHEAQAWFDRNNVRYELRNVSENAENRARMEAISGQTKAPTFEYGDFIVADFDVDEFLAAVDKVPAIKAELGLG